MTLFNIASKKKGKCGLVSKGTIFILGLLPIVACSAVDGAITGKVVNSSGPVAGAVVRVQAGDRFTTTDENGSFKLSGLTPDKPVKLTAWAPGYYIGGGQRTVLPGDQIDLLLTPLMERDNPNYTWISAFANANGSNNCQNCHAQQDNPLSPLPFDEWRRDAHANSALNERFLSMYLGRDTAGNQSPTTRKGYSRDYGSFPLRPDPDKSYYGPGYKLDFPETAGNCAACHLPAAAVNAPYGTDPTSASGAEAEGVACDFCHKVWGVKLGTTGLPYPNMPGVLSFEFLRPPEGHQFFAGPLADVAPGEDTYSPIQRQSQFCAACHFGEFWGTIIYNSFGEWLESPYSDPKSGRTCQDCHMPAGRSDHFALFEVGGLTRDPKTIASHLMPGASDHELISNAATMEVDAHRQGGKITVEVDIINDKTGHHIPTDSPLRHLILLVVASDSQGSRLEQLSGPTVPDWGGLGDPDLGYYAGLPGTAYAKVLEEAWTGISPSGAYWNPTRIVSDNRIPAFKSASSEYAFQAPDGDQITIDIKLLYRRAFIELMDQKGWNAPDILMAEQTLYLY